MPVTNIQRYDWINYEKERYPVIWSAYNGDLDGLRQHLKQVKDVTEVKDTTSDTSILGWAVVGDQVTIIKYLINRYPQLLTLTNKYGASPLFLCSVSGNVDMFKLFVKEGLSPYRRIVHLDTVLMLTAARGHLNLTRYIVETYPDMVRKISNTNMDVFLYSCYSGSVDIFDYMLQQKLDPTVLDIDDINCLMIAAWCGHEILLRYILENARRFNINIHATDVDGHSPVFYSMMGNHPDITDILKRYGMKPPNAFRILISVPKRLFRKWRRESGKEVGPQKVFDDYLRLFSGPKEKYRHIRVVFVGPENVGKTTLCLRLQGRHVDIRLRRPTLGAELFLQLYEIGWDSKRWTHLDTDRPEVVIHKRLGEILRNTSVVEDNTGNNDAETQALPSTADTGPITAESKHEIKELPSTADTSSITYRSEKEKQPKPAPFVPRRTGLMIVVIAIIAVLMSMFNVTTGSSVLPTISTLWLSLVQIFNRLQECIWQHQVVNDSVSNYVMLPFVVLCAILLAVGVRRITERIFKGNQQRHNINREMAEITREDESDEVYHQSRQQDEGVAFLSMWDMGGDLGFQATNSLFVSAHGVYIVTFRAIDYFTDDIQMVRLKNWVRNIGAYSSRVYNPSKQYPHHPPIILVGTHMDQVNSKFKNESPEENKTKLEDMWKDICSITELTNVKKAEGFVFLRFCTVNNSIDDDPAFEKIRKHILEAAAYQDQWERELPATWLALEREILIKRKWKHVLTFQEIQDMDVQCESSIGEEEEIKMFLEYLHSTRSVLYFRKYGKVIINPQWVMNAFREILTDKKFPPTDDVLLGADYFKYTENAILTVNLAKKLWQSKEDNSYIQHVDILFTFLEEFGLLLKACLGQDKEGKPLYDDDYTVPSKLEKAPQDMNPISNLLEGKVRSRTLCFVFEDVFTPQELFDRIYAGIIKTFRPAEETSGNLRIYKGLGCFKIDDLCNMVVRMHWEQSVIAVTLFTTSEPKIPDDTGTKVRQKLETIIRHTLKVSRQEHMEYRYKLHCRFYLKPSDNLREEDGIVRTTQGLPCQGEGCSGKHYLTKQDWHKWFPVPSETKNIESCITTRSYANELLTDKGLQESAKQLGANWECVMTQLRVSSSQLERIKLVSEKSSNRRKSSSKSGSWEQAAMRVYLHISSTTGQIGI
ncbi:serine/threonine-protein kinase roco5 [Mizuhopecten yessoensis]|uniref:Serine/threonine-protein kinase roco5 n=1 Tax=Mizuhopecten yessoensis TaxID=6573 RepID=A0A210Q668_MIZYE|nr:serine/threonine-protein kinase roco5 [Mizuhopecten yessoensis]